MPTDPNDTDFADNIKRLVGIDAKGIEVLLPKLDPKILIDLAAAVTNSDKVETLRLIRAGRFKAMSEDQLHPRKPVEARVRKGPETLLDDESFVDLSIGDAVEFEGNKAVVKLPKGPGNTVGVTIKGKMEMVNRKDVSKIDEGVLGMTAMPNLARMQQLAGIPDVTEVPIAPVEAAISVEDTDVGSHAMGLLDQLTAALPNLRLGDLSAVRKRMNEISVKINESVGIRPVTESRKRKV